MPNTTFEDVKGAAKNLGEKTANYIEDQRGIVTEVTRLALKDVKKSLRQVLKKIDATLK